MDKPGCFPDCVPEKLTVLTLAHDLRRTLVGYILDRGVVIATVANIAGHASIDTTRRYDRRPEETKRKAAGKLHFPYIPIAK